MDSHRPERMEGKLSWDRVGSRIEANWNRRRSIREKGCKVGVDSIRGIGAVICETCRVRERRRGGRMSSRDIIAVAIFS